MLRFIKDNMATIDGIEIYPIISLLIFFTVFSIAIYWTMKVDKKKIDVLEQMPLSED